MMSVKWNFAFIVSTCTLIDYFAHWCDCDCSCKCLLSYITMTLQLLLSLYVDDCKTVLSLSLFMLCAAGLCGARQQRLHMSMACSSISLLLLTYHLLGVFLDPSNVCHAIPADACTVHQLPSRFFCGPWIAAFPCPLLSFISVVCSLVSFPNCLYCCHSYCNGSHVRNADTSCPARTPITATAIADISLSLLSLRTSLLSQHMLVDISRCALTTIHYPEHRTLTADEPAAEPLPATMQHLAATAEALLAGGGHRWQTTTAACDISASSGGQRQSAADPTAAVRDSSSNQAESSSHMTEGFSRSGVTAKEGPQSKEHVVPVAVRHHAAGYDPVWMLLWALKVTTF